MRTIVIVFASLIVALAGLIIVTISTKTYEQFKNIADVSQLITAIITIGALFFLGYQISLQREDFSLDKRPYLYVYLEPKFNLAGGGPQLFGGGYLHYINKGKIPASDVQLDFEISSDVNRDAKLKQWYTESYGDFPEVKTVFPDQDNDKVFIHPQIGNDAKLCYLAVRVTYSSTETKKRYWYKYRTLVHITRDDQNLLVSDQYGNCSVLLIYTYTDWDRNSDTAAPALEQCDWDKHLQAKLVKK